MDFDQDNSISILFLLKPFRCFRNVPFDRGVSGDSFFLPLKLILVLINEVDRAGAGGGETKNPFHIPYNLIKVNLELAYLCEKWCWSSISYCRCYCMFGRTVFHCVWLCQSLQDLTRLSLAWSTPKLIPNSDILRTKNTSLFPTFPCPVENFW